jgi:hypothetical protein
MVRQHRDIFWPAPQWQELDARFYKPLVKLGIEKLVGNRARKICTSRRDQSDVDELARAFAATTRILAQRFDQSTLRAAAHMRDFFHQQCAASRAPEAIVDGRFIVVVVGIDAHEIGGASRTHLVEQSRDALATRAALTFDEHRRVAMSDLAYAVAKLDHRGRVSEQLIAEHQRHAEGLY